MTNATPHRKVLALREVLVEPGSTQLWVSCGEQTHRVDLAPLLAVPLYQPLRLSSLFRRVRISADARHLVWPGGLRIDAASIQLAPAGAAHLQSLAVMPWAQRYRPLWPYLSHHQPPLYLHPVPVAPTVVQRLLQVRPADIEQMVQASAAPAEVILSRLYDLALLLNTQLSPEHVYGVLRKPWAFGEQHAPRQPLLHTMLGCLKFGRPDLVERPCLLLEGGEWF